MTAEDTKPGRRERAAAPRTDAGAMDAPNRDVAVQYGRRVEADRSWPVYHVFTGVPAREHDRPMTGLCRSRLEILPDGRYRLHEEWQWTSGDKSRGTSMIEEVPR